MVKVTLLFSLLFLYSCGESPLFNHENESAQSIEGTAELSSNLSFKKTGLNLKINWMKGPFPDPSLENNFLIIVQNMFVKTSC